MIHIIKEVSPLRGHRLNVHFAEGIIKTYDVGPLARESAAFSVLKRNPELFFQVRLSQGGDKIEWDNNVSLYCDELFENGKTIESPFNGLMAFSDATRLWGMNESTLRKAISYGKLVVGVDACKFGNVWIISVDAMVREYGRPREIDFSKMDLHRNMLIEERKDNLRGRPLIRKPYFTKNRD